MKKLFLRTAAALLAAVSLFPQPVLGLSARKAILMDATTGQVIFEKDAHSRSLIASTTKIMTALVVCQQCNVLDRVRIPKEAVGIEGSSMYLQEGEVLTVQDLLYGLMLRSGNDAAVALAIYCGGTVEGFAELMNDKASLLGLKDTHFENPHGLDSPGHYSTAHDLAVLSAYAMENPVFRKTVSAKTVTAGHRSMTNHNKLLWRLDGAEGIKTGYTKAAGRLLVSSAQRQGRRLIAVTIDAGDDWNDHASLMEKGFSDYKIRQVVTKDQVVGSLAVFGGEQERVEVVAAEEFSYALTSQEQVRLVLSGTGFVYAPVAEGQSAGFAYVCIGDRAVGKVPVVFRQTVGQKTVRKKHFWDGWFGG